MYPILFQLGPITIYSFGAFMALAALSAAWVVHSELKRRGYDPEVASSMVFAAAIGGFFGGAAAVSWIVRKNQIPWLVGADIAAPALAIAYGVGRLGCHFAGDGDWGSITDVPWGVAYTNAIIGWVDPMTGVPYPAGVRVHPTPIYEFLQSIVIFTILWS